MIALPNRPPNTSVRGVLEHASFKVWCATQLRLFDARENARPASGHVAAPANQHDEIASSHCPRPRQHQAKPGLNLTDYSKETRAVEWGSMVSLRQELCVVRHSKISRAMSGGGHFRQIDPLPT